MGSKVCVLIADKHQIACEIGEGNSNLNCVGDSTKKFKKKGKQRQQQIQTQPHQQ